MKKVLIFAFLIVIVLVFGLFLVKNSNLRGFINKIAVTKKITPKPLPLIFDKLSEWVPSATWGELQKSIQMTPYGKTTGFSMDGEIKGDKASIKHNFEDQKLMNSLGFFEDINFAADGPGSSNWGYSKTENGKTQIVVFRYSSNTLLGPESKNPPFVNLSVYVSDPFKLSD